MQAEIRAQPQEAAKSGFQDLPLAKCSDGSKSDCTFIDMYYNIISITFVEVETSYLGHLWTQEFGNSDLITYHVFLYRYQ